MAVALLTAACGDYDGDDGWSAAEQTNVTAVTRVIQEGLVGGDLDVIDDLVREDYIQHNLQAETGRAGLVSFVESLRSQGPTDAQIHRVLADDDMVALHVSYGIDDPDTDSDDRTVAFDVFRLERGQLAEHWDALTPAVTGAESVSGRSNTDGATQVTNRDETEQNRALVREFVDVVFTQGQYDQLGTYIGETYLQHSPMAGDGIAGLQAVVQQLTEMGVAIGYTASPLIVADGNFVLAGSRGFFGPVDDPPTALFYELWRVESGLLVEHWDVIAANVPAEADLPHRNGYF